MPDPYPQTVIAVLLLILNVLFALGGESFKTLNKAILNRKAEDEDKTARKITKIMDRPDLFRAALSTGRALCKAGAVALILSAYQGSLSDALNFGDWSSLVAIAILVIATALVFILLGELLPIRVAEQKADDILYPIWGTLRFFTFLFYPLAFPLNLIVTLLIQLFGLEQTADEALSKEEIQTLVEESSDSGLLEEHERDMLEGIFDFNEKTADQVMTPRTEVFLIDGDAPLSEYLEEMLNEKYSRIPVYREKVDNIVGILYLKDFLCEAYRVGFENVDITTCIHDAYFVPERKRLDDLYRELQESKNHMAVLIDEYGGFSGVVTIEDLIEEVMGDIDDEYDEEEEEIRSENDGSFVAEGSATIAEINEHLDLTLDEDNEDYDTVGGLIIKLLGYIPEENEALYLEYEGCSFQVEKISDRRIESVRIRKLEQAEEKEENE
ncbi:MAG: HlyC/CorC family transporter [Clostridia bacterium]|nr:HlyC/CorC family transporter [Clostridia bacterium]